MYRRFVSLLGFALVACATYTGAQQAEEGELDGRCYPNGTCNVGLLCVGAKCAPDPSVADADTRVDAGLPAQEDADSDGSQSRGASDAYAAGKISLLRTSPNNEPAGVVEGVDSSCINFGTCCGTNHVCTQSCTDIQVRMPCDGPEDCSQGNRCCGLLGTKDIDTSACPRGGSFSKLVTRCASSCLSTEVELCTGNTCGAGQRCTRLLATLGLGGGSNFSIGFCE